MGRNLATRREIAREPSRRLQMGRSKERGRPVSELSERELASEKLRCETLIKVYGNNIAAKGLKKRLLQIEKRLAR